MIAKHHLALEMYTIKNLIRRRNTITEIEVK